MAKPMRKHDTHLPRKLLKTLNEDFLKKGEVIIDFMHETFIFTSFDFRWVILTNQRLIIAIRHLIATTHRVMDLDGLEYDFTKGAFFYDVVEFSRRTEFYRATFYSTDRMFVKEFLDSLQKVQVELEKQSQMERSEAALEPVQTLEDLAELRDRGIVSEREFKKAKEDFLKKFREEKEET